MKPHNPPTSSLHWPGQASGSPVSKSVVGGFPWADDGPPQHQATVDTATDGVPAGPDLPPHVEISIRDGVGDGLGRAPAPANSNAPASPLRAQVEALIRWSPAWSVSLSLHCVLLLVLTLWVVREKRVEKLRLSLAFATSQVAAAHTGIDISPAREPTKEPAPMKTEIANTPLPPVERPAAAAPMLPPDSVEPTAVSSHRAPAVGMALAGRDAGRKRVLLGAAGGNDATEVAVALALKWLASKQNVKDGLWSLRGPYADGGSQENTLAATAMALLALQGAGNTTSEGLHRAAVARAWRTVLKAQQPDGSFDLGDIPEQHKLYSHAQATIALCELYGMTHDEKLAAPAGQAVAYALAAQGPDGGWRYKPGQMGDMSVTGWYLMALKTAEMSGLKVPPATFEMLGEFIDSVAVEKGTRYGYMRYSPLKPARGVTPAVTAEALLCRQYLGWPQRDPRLIEGLERLVGENMLEFEREKNVYAWYYITQVAHHMDGDPWLRWNDRLRELLPREQVAKGSEHGSWDPALDKWGHVGGRLFTTSFCALMLEVYYRHAPLYAAEAESP